MSFRILLLDPKSHPAGCFDEILRPYGAITLEYHDDGEAKLLDLARDADAILVANRQVDKPLISKMERCRVIARVGTGYDNVDLKAAGEAGIPVTNVPDFCSDEVADHTMTLVLACWKKLIPSHEQLRSGVWAPFATMPVHSLRGQILGLVGFGRIGRAVAERAAAFGLKIHYYDPLYSGPGAGGATRCESLEELLSSSDIVSLHLPLSIETRGLISTKEFRQMKRSAILINSARGAIIDEKALVQALQERLIQCAGLDAFEQEPVTAENPLLKFDNIVLTPHTAAHTVEAMSRLRRQAAEEVARAIRGEALKNVVNRAYLKNARTPDRMAETQLSWST